MNKETDPLVAIPMSVYNDLVNKKYENEAPFLLVGSRYTVKDADNCTNTWVCQTKVLESYELVNNGPLGTRRMTITLQKK